MLSKQYFEDHTINPEFVKNKLGWSWNETKITIPVHDTEGNFLYNKYRHLTGESKFTFDLGGHPLLYGLNYLQGKEKVVLTEGESDCARLLQENIAAVTSTGGVGSFKKDIATPLKGKQVYVTLDNDEVGQSMIEQHYRILEEVGALPKIVELPSGVKDICEYFAVGFTEKDFNKLLSKAQKLEDWQDTHEPELYKLESVADLLTDPLDEEEWLVDRILPVEGFCFIAGAEATGKSFYAIDLALSVVSGKSWLGQFKVNKQVNVLLVDKENTRRRLQKRFRGLNAKENEFKIYLLKNPLKFDLYDERGTSEFAKSLSRKVKQFDIGLIVVDSFTDLLAGNENAREDVQDFFELFRNLFSGCSFLVLHHVNKPSPGAYRTSSQKFRGSSNITAQIYSGFLAQTVRNSKTAFTLEQTKSGDSEKLNKFLVEMVVEPDPIKEDSTMVTRIEYKDEVSNESTKIEEAQQLIVELFSDRELISRKAIEEYCINYEISKRTVGTAIKQMVEEEILTELSDPKDRRRRNYSLADKKNNENDEQQNLL